MRHLHLNGKLEIDFFKDSSFAELRMTIDAEMKRPKASGESSKQKQVGPISVEEKEPTSSCRHYLILQWAVFCT